MPHSAEDVDADTRAFDELRAVLDGRRRHPLDNRSSKMLALLLGGDRDAEITPAQFVVHYAPQKRRRPSTYFRRLAPAALSELLGRAGCGPVTTPVVLGLPAGQGPDLDSPRWTYEATLVWLVPHTASVQLFVRKTLELFRPFVEAIPVQGVLSLPPALPDWAPPDVVFKELDVERACPHCGVASMRYRKLEEVLVCQRCGRSFKTSA